MPNERRPEQAPPLNELQADDAPLAVELPTARHLLAYADAAKAANEPLQHVAYLNIAISVVGQDVDALVAIWHRAAAAMLDYRSVKLNTSNTQNWAFMTEPPGGVASRLCNTIWGRLVWLYKQGKCPNPRELGVTPVDEIGRTPKPKIEAARETFFPATPIVVFSNVVHITREEAKQPLTPFNYLRAVRLGYYDAETDTLFLLKEGN